MHLIYCSALFLSILGSFLFFIWLVIRINNMAAYQVIMEPQLENHMWKSKGPRYTRHTSEVAMELINTSDYNGIPADEEESRLMSELDNIKDKQELKEWFELLKAGYKHRTIPSKIQLRVSTVLKGYIWFKEEEYARRIQEGMPVKNITKREYALEKKLQALTTVNRPDKT